MYVRQLVGRLAGTIVQMPFSAATSNIAAGTCATVTDDEITAAGLQLEPVPSDAAPDGLPAGFRVEPTEGGGFDLLDAGGVRLNDEPFPNLPAARSFAAEHIVAQTTVAVIDLSQVPGQEPQVLLLDAYRFEPVEGGGFNLFDPGGVLLNPEPFEDEEAVLLARRQHYAAARGMTPEELEAEEAGPGLQPTGVDVPQDWESLHHAKRRALAKHISGEDPENTEAADRTIRAYLAARQV
ncbi:hypothetical protein [Methylobacterium segetis]|uniref:hypothetical protein n=1 Tax=Methylobacterium segetis TaxID=2488750 RepID=UPI00104A47A9|nr:hypothetical protein [Methylobacterium segetis]